MRLNATQIGVALRLSTGRTSTPQSNAVTTQKGPWYMHANLHALPVLDPYMYANTISP